jgi:hypothetical protein
MFAFVEYDHPIGGHGEPRELSFPALCEYFERFEVGPKDGRCFSSAVFNGNRPSAMTGLALEFRGEDPEAVRDRLVDFGVHFILYPAYSNTIERPAFNILIPFREPLLLAHPSAWARLIYPRLIKHFGFERAEKCPDPERRYALPRRPHVDLRFETICTDDSFEPLDARSVVGDVLRALEIPMPTETPLAPEEPEHPIDQKDLRRRLGGHDSRAARRLARGLPITDVVDERSIAVAWCNALTKLAMVVHDWESSARLIEVCVPSLDRMGALGDLTTLDQLKELLISIRSSIPQARAARAHEAAILDAIECLANADSVHPAVEAASAARI